jgi:hypothetical protein
MKTYIITEADGSLRQVRSPIHPCDEPLPGHEPLYAGDRRNVIDVEADPDNPAWLRYRGAISDETYDRLKASGKVTVKNGIVAIADQPKKAKRK